MAKFRKKSEPFDAVQWFKEGDHPDVVKVMKTGCHKVFLPDDVPTEDRATSVESHGIVNQGGLPVEVVPSCWIVQGGYGLYNVYSSEIFTEEFEPVTDEVTALEDKSLLQNSLETCTTDNLTLLDQVSKLKEELRNCEQEFLAVEDENAALEKELIDLRMKNEQILKLPSQNGERAYKFVQDIRALENKLHACEQENATCEEEITAAARNACGDCAQLVEDKAEKVKVAILTMQSLSPSERAFIAEIAKLLTNVHKELAEKIRDKGALYV